MRFSHDSIIRFYSYFESVVLLPIDISGPEELHAWPEINSMAHENSFDVFLACQQNNLPEFLQSMVSELLDLHYNHLNVPSIRRKTHIRQVAIYLSNVSFGISMRQLAMMFNLNRSTISYACRTVEERRDDGRYDRFLVATEKIALLATANHKVF